MFILEPEWGDARADKWAVNLANFRTHPFAVTGAGHAVIKRENARDNMYECEDILSRADSVRVACPPIYCKLRVEGRCVHEAVCTVDGLA